MHLPPMQLFDTESCTYTYLLAAPGDKSAVLIDPVHRHLERDLQLLERLGLTLDWVLETHAHADHVTSAGRLRERTGARAGVPGGCGIAGADQQLADGAIVRFGQNETLVALHTPGHTAGSMSFLWRGNVFTGDTLLIGGCGRADFQGGDAATLYTSITTRLFTLLDTTRVWPGHDYHGRTVSTIGWEKQHNGRLAGRSQGDFVDLMAKLALPRPALIDVALPANRELGLRHES